MLVRITEIAFAPDKLDEALPLFEERTRALVGEPGCLGAVFGRSPDDACSAVAISLWADRTAYAAHEETDAYAGFARRVLSAGLLVGAPRITAYEVAFCDLSRLPRGGDARGRNPLLHNLQN